jgi:hypothetical protein
MTDGEYQYQTDKRSSEKDEALIEIKMTKVNDKSNEKSSSSRSPAKVDKRNWLEDFEGIWPPLCDSRQKVSADTFLSAAAFVGHLALSAPLLKHSMRWMREGKVLLLFHSSPIPPLQLFTCSQSAQTG